MAGIKITEEEGGGGFPACESDCERPVRECVVKCLDFFNGPLAGLTSAGANAGAIIFPSPIGGPTGVCAYGGAGLTGYTLGTGAGCVILCNACDPCTF